MALHYQIIPVTPFEQNCSLLWCDETMEGTLIDAGGDAAKLRTAVAKAGVKITKLLLTHGHLDHVGAASVARSITIICQENYKQNPAKPDRGLIAFSYCRRFCDGVGGLH